MNAHAKFKFGQLRNEKRMLEQNIEIHKKQLLAAKDGQFKTMLEKSIKTDGERLEVVTATIAAVAPLAGETAPAPAAPKPAAPPPA